MLLVFGCAVKQPIPKSLVKFTDTSFVEYNKYNYDFHVYHIRYSSDKPDSAHIDFIAGVYNIDGISDITAGKYWLTIKKSPGYSWVEIEPRLKELILQFEKAKPEKPDEPKTKIDRKGGV